VVVVVGDTFNEPAIGKFAGPPGAIVTAVAFVVVHVSVVDCPAVIVAGDAANCTVTVPAGGGPGCGPGGGDALVPPQAAIRIKAGIKTRREINL
jgi:hypothetical protein